MTELRILKSKDIRLSIDGEQLFGVTDFSAVSRRKGHEIREYLNGSPVKTVNEREEHELKLSVLSIFTFAVWEKSDFELCCDDGENRYCYEGCRTLSRTRDVQRGNQVTDVYLITAQRMRKQVCEND